MSAKVYSSDIESADLDFESGIACLRVRKSPAKLSATEDAATVLPISPAALVLAVADGVGGAPGGRDAANEVMSSIAAITLPEDNEDVSLRSAIIDSIEHANREIILLGRGAGTTVAVAEVSDGAVRTYHVGDSEILVVGQRGKIKQRIVPHSPTGFAVEAGLLEENAAVHHEYRHILLNVVGSPGMRIEVGVPLLLSPKDTLLIASDGLFDNMYLDEIVNTIRCGPLTEAADNLVKLVGTRMMRTVPSQMPSKPDDLALILFRPKHVKRRRRAARAKA